MGQSLNIKLRGLYTFPNDYSAIPEGALSQADNVIVDRESVAEPRRGFTYQNALTVPAYFTTNMVARKIFYYQNQILAFCSLGFTTNNLSTYYYDSTTATGWTQMDNGYINFPATGILPRSAQANQNIYFTTSYGVRRVDYYKSSSLMSGMPQALAPKCSENSSTNWLGIYGSVRYRVVWGYVDANNNLVLSAPSTDVWFLNGAAVKSVYIDLSCAIPSQIAYMDSTKVILQIYRSLATDGSSLIVTAGSFIRGVTYVIISPGTTDFTLIGATNSIQGTIFIATGVGVGTGTASAVKSVSPNDELYLCYESTYAAFIAAYPGLAFTDDQPEALLGASLYTNASQEGFGNANTVIPAALDIAEFRDSMFYANIAEIQHFTLTILSLPTVADTITIAGVVMTAHATEVTSSSYFITGTTITACALSIIRVFNRYCYAHNLTYYAQYLSSATGIPGIISIEASNPGLGSIFYLTSSAGSVYKPALPVSGTTISSTGDYSPNGIAFSKTQQPESVPLQNRIYVGSKDKAILRIIPLRDSLFILKEDGIYRLYGTDPTNFQVALLDATANCIAPETAVIMNNMIFSLTTQGVVTISETGVTIMSRPIEGDLLGLLALQLNVPREQTYLWTSSFAVSYESARSYHLFVPSTASDTYPTQCYRYNTLTNNWTRWILSKYCGGVNPNDDRLYLGNATKSWLDVENKNFSSFDYADYVKTITITNVTAKVVSMSSTTGLVAGMVLYQSSILWGEIASVAVGSVTMKYAIAFANAAADVVSPIPCSIKWAPCTFANPGLSKQVREISVLMLSDFFGSGTVSFETEISPAIAYETVSGCMSAPWGQFPWGQAPWGMSAKPRRRSVRVMVPRIHQRCSMMTIGFQHDVCFSPWQIQGISVIGNNVSERVWQEGDTV